MDRDEFGIEKGLEELFTQELEQEIDFELTLLDVDNAKRQNFNLLDSALLSQGFDLRDEGIKDFFDYEEQELDRLQDITFSRIHGVLTSLGTLAYRQTSFDRIKDCDEFEEISLVSIFLYSDDNEEKWLEAIREILPELEMLKDEDSRNIIDNFRNRAIIQNAIDENMFDLRTNAKKVITEAVNQRFGHHDDNSNLIMQLLFGVIGIYGGYTPESNDMHVTSACEAMREHGFTDEETIDFLKTVHDIALSL